MSSTDKSCGSLTKFYSPRRPFLVVSRPIHFSILTHTDGDFLTYLHSWVSPIQRGSQNMTCGPLLVCAIYAFMRLKYKENKHLPTNRPLSLGLHMTSVLSSAVLPGALPQLPLV